MPNVTLDVCGFHTRCFAMTCGGRCKLLPDLDGLAVLADDINTGRQVVEADVCAILDLCNTDESAAHSIDAQQSVAFGPIFGVSPLSGSLPARAEP